MPRSARCDTLPGPVSDVEVTQGAAVAGRVEEISVWVGSIPAGASARAKQPPSTWRQGG